VIPYFKLTVVPFGPLNIQIWGFFVVSGIMIALLLARQLVLRTRLNFETLLDLVVWALLPALVMGRLGFVFFYHPSILFENFWRVFSFWDGGMSSFGSYIGVALGVWLFVWRKKIELRSYAEIAAYVFPLGYGVGRIGCFLIHDHPGIFSTSFLAVAFPDGARLDHGLLLSLFGFLLFGIFYLLGKRKQIPGNDWYYLPILLLVYGAARLTLDFLRAWDLSSSDARFFYLTPAQYGAIILLLVGLCLLRDRHFFLRKSLN
jgi:phosphatidylglycerol:prolipoprotein diacylglycerol transferase